MSSPLAEANMQDNVQAKESLIPPEAPNLENDMDICDGRLWSCEVWWRDRQQWLEERGYMLRPRYRPGWKPSWAGTKKWWFWCEDGVSPRYYNLLDATRIADGKVVMLKRFLRSDHPYEAEIGQFFSSEPLASDPRNHCVPIYDTLQDPYDSGTVILVMPLLRLHHDPPPTTVGEVVEALRQIFEGMHFMHEHRVAHRDCMVMNTMMESVMFPNLWHPQDLHYNRKCTASPKHYTRTERPPKYYIIDFGLSRRYDVNDPSPRELPIIGGDKTVPEYQGAGYWIASDPFATDVYYLGHMIQQYYLNIFIGLEFLDTLVTDMTQADPSKRPTMGEIVAQFEQICSKCTIPMFRGRLHGKKESPMFRRMLDIRHAFVSMGYRIRGLPALPRPRT